VSGVWSTLQATVGAPSEGPWIGYTVVSRQVWNSAYPSIISQRDYIETERDRAEVETLGESPDISEGAREGTEASLRSTEEKDSESESISRDTQQGRLGQRDTSWYLFATSALSFPANLWHGRVWPTVKEHTSGVLL
jgi:hypothetical protein